jgi:tripartite-type tricarboxylate transporter receptor subunit TctC
VAGRFFAPAKTPPEIVRKVGGDLAKRNAYTVESTSPDELAKFLKADTEKWEAIIKTTGIKID